MPNILQEKRLSFAMHPKWDKTKSDIYILKGILAAYQDDLTEAENLFQKASKTGNSLAKANLKILNGDPLEGAVLNVSNNPNKDQIDGFSIDKAIVQLLKGELKVDKLVNVNKTTMCGIKHLENATLLIHFIDENNYTFIQMTGDKSTSATSVGIKQGSSNEDVFSKYSQPDNKITTSNGSYLVYYSQNLLFSLSKSGKVQNWGVFRKKVKK